MNDAIVEINNPTVLDHARQAGLSASIRAQCTIASFAANTSVVCLFVLLSLEMVSAIRWQSQTFDEANHILAGYRYWRCSDFGTNPEHPPLVKLIAAFPLLFSRLQVPVALCGSSHASSSKDFVDGRAFLYANDANQVLFRTRVATGTITVILALVLFTATREMFEFKAALLALALFVFEPNLLAHGTLVHTDMGVTFGLFAAVYAFYRYVREPRLWRLIVLGLAVGVALAAKLSGILIVPFLACLAIAEVCIRHARNSDVHQTEYQWKVMLRDLVRLAGALAIAGAIALVVLWGVYGFRFSARPNGEPIVSVVETSRSSGTGLLATIPRWHLLPEAYYYGLSYQLMMAHVGRASFLLGKLYPHGKWFYFPLVFLIKSTLGFLLLLSIAITAKFAWGNDRWREAVFLSLPPLLLLAGSLISANNLGIRYILPIYPFLIVLAAGGACSLAKQHRRWAYAVVALLAMHGFSSLRSRPNYLAYSNEVWGGPSHTYRLLTDSNVDWGQSLKATKAYLDRTNVSDCWFAFPGTADPNYYGIPCRHLDPWPNPEVVPETIRGTVLISVSELSGFFSGPGELNPYAQFVEAQPKDNISGNVLVFNGSFDVTLASALSHSNNAVHLAEIGRVNEAIAEAQKAVALAPRNPSLLLSLGQLLARAQRATEARSVYQTALSSAQTVHPEFEKNLILSLQKELQH